MPVTTNAFLMSSWRSCSVLTTAPIQLTTNCLDGGRILARSSPASFLLDPTSVVPGVLGLGRSLPPFERLVNTHIQHGRTASGNDRRLDVRLPKAFLHGITRCPWKESITNIARSLLVNGRRHVFTQWSINASSTQAFSCTATWTTGGTCTN